MILSDDECRNIESYLDQGSSELEGTFDVAFVFGTKLPDPAHITAELLLRERVRYAMLTGGANRTTGRVESQDHLEILKTAGISNDRVLFEGRSKNTHENVCFGLDKFWSVFRYHEVKRILAITKWYHSRRALMTLKKQLPKEIEVVAYSYEPEGCTRENWFQNSQSLWLVMKEWKTIPQYLEIGHLAELDA
jgi:uncharacterized SAM-binding protein YcdF (DUF218 family)